MLHVISVGGSLIVPQEKPNAVFLEALRNLLTGFIQRGDRFVLVTGGGKTARVYIDAAKSVTDLVNDDLDWLGIHATRLNAHLLRTIFRDVAHPVVVKHPLATPLIEQWKGSVLVAAGWKPGRSTDYVASRIAKRLGVKTVINMSNITKVYTGDPKKDPSAVPKDEMSWREYRKMVGSEWSPGLSAPFDPIASKFCEKNGMRVVVIGGMRMEPLLHYLLNGAVDGTVLCQFITDEGGITCHAAIIARELGKPCIIGTKIATQVLKDGDMVEVDAEKGIVRLMSK